MGTIRLAQKYTAIAIGRPTTIPTLEHSTNLRPESSVPILRAFSLRFVAHKIMPVAIIPAPIKPDIKYSHRNAVPAKFPSCKSVNTLYSFLLANCAVGSFKESNNNSPVMP